MSSSMLQQSIDPNGLAMLRGKLMPALRQRGEAELRAPRQSGNKAADRRDDEGGR